MAVTNTPDKSEMKAIERVERRLNSAWAKHGFMTLTVSDLRELLTLARASSRPADQVPDMVDADGLDVIEALVADATAVEGVANVHEGSSYFAERVIRRAVEQGTLIVIGPKNHPAHIAALQAVPAASGGVGETERLRDILDTERYKVAIGVQAIARAIQGRRWLSEPGRGSYAWDDERYQQEFGAALDEIEAALKPLRAIAQDWSDCPRDPLRVAANRDAAIKASGEE